MGSAIEPLKIAILMNGFESPRIPVVRSSFISAISAASSFSITSSALPPMIDFYDPIVAQQYPDPADYDLIVLAGGTVDPTGDIPWVLKMQNFLRTTVSQYPERKILGICWGHQTINVTFGGLVANGPALEIGVSEVKLTAKGKEMFPFATEGRLDMHEYHRREVKTPAKGFTALAAGNQSFLNDANTIMTFQGHPEMTENVGKTMLQDTPSYMELPAMELYEISEKMELPHDGMKLWKRILEWVGE